MADGRLPRGRIRYCNTLSTPRAILRPPHSLSLTPSPAYLPSLLPTVFVVVVASIIWLIWNDSCISSTPQLGKMEPVGTDSAFYFPSGKVLLGHSPPQRF
jgi:hypothetical protein